MARSAVVEHWFSEHTWQNPQFGLEQLRAAKGGRRISVVLPALNEAATVADVVRAASHELVDELVVLDSGSTDDTAERATAAGARVVHREDVLPELEPLPGKGEVLWRSLAATTGDVIVFLDSDLIDPDPEFVPSLLGPMLTMPGIQLCKGFYRRPLRMETHDADTGGGRVTELLARPVLDALRPELKDVIQPLGGEYAVTREFAEAVPFAPGYGVEIGLLLDAHGRYGLEGIAQVNLGVRKHRNRSLQQLGVMARQILGAALARAGHRADATEFRQFVQVAGEWLPGDTAVRLTERPPMASTRVDVPRSQS